MTKPFIILMMAASAAFAQYKVEPAGTAPADLPPAIAGSLQKDGHKVVGPNGPLAEVWFVAKTPAGPAVTDLDVSLKTIPQGALMGVLRFPAKGGDRRGQPIAPGVYTLRYSQHPVNGDHVGVSNTRDFLLMTPAGEDSKADAAPGFDELVVMSRKASRTQHPAVLSLAASGESKFPEVKMEGEHDWVLHAKAGDTALALTLVGISEH
jgi:hypothetical protein